jgi:hypothetical protein
MTGLTSSNRPVVASLKATHLRTLLAAKTHVRCSRRDQTLGRGHRRLHRPFYISICLPANTTYDLWLVHPYPTKQLHHSLIHHAGCRELGKVYELLIVAESHEIRQRLNRPGTRVVRRRGVRRKARRRKVVCRRIRVVRRWGVRWKVVDRLVRVVRRRIRVVRRKVVHRRQGIVPSVVAPIIIIIESFIYVPLGW